MPIDEMTIYKMSVEEMSVVVYEIFIDAMCVDKSL
jgi:hypothetical protein